MSYLLVTWHHGDKSLYDVTDQDDEVRLFEYFFRLITEEWNSTPTVEPLKPSKPMMCEDLDVLQKRIARYNGDMRQYKHDMSQWDTIDAVRKGTLPFKLLKSFVWDHFSCEMNIEYLDLREIE